MSCSKKLLVCTKGKSCPRRDSVDVLRWLRKAISRYDLDDCYKLKKAECFGLCDAGPIVSVDGVNYGGVAQDDCRKIIKHHAKKEKPIRRLLVGKTGKKGKKH